MKGRKVNLNEFCKQFENIQQPVVFFIGAVAKGDPSKGDAMEATAGVQIYTMWYCMIPAVECMNTRNKWWRVIVRIINNNKFSQTCIYKHVRKCVDTYVYNYVYKYVYMCVYPYIHNCIYEVYIQNRLS